MAGVGSKCSGEKFYGNTASQLQVRCLIDLAHTAGFQMAGDFVVGGLASDHDA
jgi:hypothetical protein